MSKKHRKKEGETSAQRTGEILRNSRNVPNVGGSKPKRHVSNETVVENDIPIDLSKRIINWEGDKDLGLIPNLIRDGNLEGMFDSVLKEAMSRMDEQSREEVIDYINLNAQGENIPKELEEKTAKWGTTMKIFMDREGLHRWHTWPDSGPRNGSMGKERG